MIDGSFIEGDFARGQIDGFGKRFFASSKSTYEGFFKDGEMHGKGKMQYGDGSVYDGGWAFSQRSGKITLHAEALLLNSECGSQSVPYKITWPNKKEK